ncbi:hypothetical protein Bca4012_012650 [Brassica carinata]
MLAYQHRKKNYGIISIQETVSSSTRILTLALSIAKKEERRRSHGRSRASSVISSSPFLCKSSQFDPISKNRSAPERPSAGGDGEGAVCGFTDGLSPLLSHWRGCQREGGRGAEADLFQCLYQLGGVDTLLLLRSPSLELWFEIVGGCSVSEIRDTMTRVTATFHFRALRACSGSPLRILANRVSAARSKERKAQYTAELEHKVPFLQIEATTLLAQLRHLQRDSMGLHNKNSELRFRLQAMEQQLQLRTVLLQGSLGSLSVINFLRLAEDVFLVAGFLMLRPCRGLLATRLAGFETFLFPVALLEQEYGAFTALPL